MTRFELSRVAGFDKKKYIRKPASEADTSVIYSEPGVYCLDGKPVIIYGRFAERYDRVLWAMKTIGFQRETRTTSGGGMGAVGRKKLGESRIFGFRPRVPFGANYCSAASTATTHPAQQNILCEFGQLLNALYETAAPETAARHSEQLKQISGEWIIPGTRFTSGIVNRDNPLHYHYDRGNLFEVMSAMAVFRRLCEGGYLSVPEFGARWMLDDHSYFLFDGQSYLHGVTPIKRLTKDAYRYSVVYYALRGMAKCGTLEEEISRVRIEKRTREKRRSVGVDPGQERVPDLDKEKERE